MKRLILVLLFLFGGIRLVSAQGDPCELNEVVISFADTIANEEDIDVWLLIYESECPEYIIDFSRNLVDIYSDANQTSRLSTDDVVVIPFENPTVMIEILNPSSLPRLELEAIANLETTLLEGVALIRFQSAGVPVFDEDIDYWDIFVGAETVSGQWAQAEDNRLRLPRYYLDENGMFVEVLPEGNYIFMSPAEVNRGAGRGTWGIMGSDDQQLVNFPIVAGKVTRITFNFARLDLALVNDSGQATTDAWIHVQCQTNDVSGQPIVLSFLDVRECGETVVGSSTGLYTFYVGAGTYLIELACGGDPQKTLLDIAVEPGEQLRVDETFPSCR